MNNKVLEEIKNFAIEKLKENYGYCGSAESDEMAMLNSDDDGCEIRITIKEEFE